MKRKLSLGLMVFFLGVVLTACGSNRTSSPAAGNGGNGQIPGGWAGDGDFLIPGGNCNGQSQCEVNRVGQYHVTNPNVYGQVFGYNTGGGDSGFNHGNTHVPIPHFQDGQMSNVGSVWDGILNCGMVLGISWLFTELSGNSMDAGCSFGSQSTNTISFASAQQLQSQYPARLAYRLIDGGQRLYEVIVRIETGNHGGQGDNFACRPTQSSVLECQSHIGSRMYMQDHRDGRYSLADQHGQVFGNLLVSGN